MNPTAPPRHVLSCTEPASRFADAFLLGDGSLGVTVAGAVGEETFDLNADTLWSGGPVGPRTDAGAADVLPALRAAVAAGDHHRADDLARRLHASGWTESYQPVGRLTWRYAAEGPEAGVSDYVRELDLARAVASTRYRRGGQDHRLESFVAPGAGSWWGWPRPVPLPPRWGSPARTRCSSRRCTRSPREPCCWPPAGFPRRSSRTTSPTTTPCATPTTTPTPTERSRAARGSRSPPWCTPPVARSG